MLCISYSLLLCCFSLFSTAKLLTVSLMNSRSPLSSCVEGIKVGRGCGKKSMRRLLSQLRRTQQPTISRRPCSLVSAWSWLARWCRYGLLHIPNVAVSLLRFYWFWTTKVILYWPTELFMARCGYCYWCYHKMFWYWNQILGICICRISGGLVLSGVSGARCGLLLMLG